MTDDFSPLILFIIIINDWVNCSLIIICFHSSFFFLFFSLFCSLLYSGPLVLSTINLIHSLIHSFSLSLSVCFREFVSQAKVANDSKPRSFLIAQDFPFGLSVVCFLSVERSSHAPPAPYLLDSVVDPDDILFVFQETPANCATARIRPSHPISPFLRVASSRTLYVLHKRPETADQLCGYRRNRSIKDAPLPCNNSLVRLCLLHTSVSLPVTMLMATGPIDRLWKPRNSAESREFCHTCRTVVSVFM